MSEPVVMGDLIKGSLDPLVKAPLLLRITVFVLIVFVVSFCLHSMWLKSQFAALDRSVNQLEALKAKVQLNVKNQTQIASQKAKLIERQARYQAYRQAMNQAVKKMPGQQWLNFIEKLKLEVIRIEFSSPVEDAAGRFYLSDITFKSDLKPMSQIILSIFEQFKFSVWQELVISEYENAYSLRLVAKNNIALLTDARR